MCLKLVVSTKFLVVAMSRVCVCVSVCALAGTHTQFKGGGLGLLSISRQHFSAA